MSQEDEHIPEWAKKMQGCIDDLNSKVGNLDSKVSNLDSKVSDLNSKVDNQTIKIKQDLFPQLVIEIRNCVRDEVSKLQQK